MRTYKVGRVPIKLWCEPEEGALAQLENLSNLPFAFHHVALMPDGHEGYGMPIGGILATEGVIVPNAVGVDIGCGMIARKLNIKREEIEPLLPTIISKAKIEIPVGFAKRPNPIHWASDFLSEIYSLPVASEEYKNSTYQVGTLGGGNHFIEVQVDTEDNVWLMIHSGSRNFGKKICVYYNKKAQEFNKKYYSQVPSNWDLAFLPIDSKEGQQYWNEMQIALQFAAINRHSMMETLTEIIAREIDNAGVTFEVNAHHNYCALENHFGKNVYIHRKGAIRAREGELGIIPGSMGTPSYIVKGLGNKDSFMSASHGAGRVMSRRKANEFITEEMAKEAMQGILHDDFKGQYDECPQAYKNIEEVINNELDLIEPIVKLRPLGVMKG
jgi:tRNA-splicing ligase RtcB